MFSCFSFTYSIKYSFEINRLKQFSLNVWNIKFEIDLVLLLRWYCDRGSLGSTEWHFHKDLMFGMWRIELWSIYDLQCNFAILECNMASVYSSYQFLLSVYVTNTHLCIKCIKCMLQIT